MPELAHVAPGPVHPFMLPGIVCASGVDGASGVDDLIVHELTPTATTLVATRRRPPADRATGAR